MRLWLLSAIPLLWLGCGTEPEEAPEVTWHRDIEPLVQQHCAHCHNGEGVGRGDFTDYATARDMAPVMVARMERGEMPPAAADPTCRDYDGSERFTITDETLDAFRTWSDLASPEGDPADAVEAPPAVPPLENPNLVLKAKAPYTPSYSEQDNEYRCFLLEHGRDTDFWITGLDAMIDTERISHHAILFIATDNRADRKVTDESTNSWSCPDVLPDGDWMFAHAWAPGSNPVNLPEGTGMRVAKDNQLVLQMHYYRNDEGDDGVADQPGYEFVVRDQVENQMFMFGLGPTNFQIPAGEEAYSASAAYNPERIAGLPISLTVHGLAPHMHVLGTGYRVWRTSADGEEECIAASEGFDFDNQPTYMLKEPVVVQPGEKFHVECTWNNSVTNPHLIHDPPIPIGFGERTDEEMCFALTYFTVGF